jgi:UDP-3-O-[3-hydroxymyristoyl] glucosamine N-acyltransferase
MTKNPRRFRLSELSQRFSLELRGDPEHKVCGVGTLAAAGPDQVSFLANRAYREILPRTAAGAVILHPGAADECPVNCLISENPYRSYASVAGLFDTRPRPAPGIHATAVVDPDASIGDEVYVGPNAVIAAGCVIGNGASIGPGCSIGAGSQLGEACRLAANVSISDGVRLGKRVIVHPGAVIGADGFGIAHAGDHWEKVPQLGGVVIGDDCEIGANTAIDRGAIEDTVLEDDVRLDNLVQIGHNVHIGAHTAIAGCAGIAGSVRIGRNCLIAGGVGVFGHLEIADGVTISALSTVTRSITEPGSSWGATFPAQPLREWHRSVARINRLDDTIRRVRALEREAEGGKGK